MAYQVTDKSTQFGYGTPHGITVPHKYPEDSQDSKTTIFLGLAKQLYPTGRAFYLPEEGTFEKMHKGTNTSLIRAQEDAISIINKSIPDNDEFLDEDATLWETKLGLFINPSTSLENRKKAILRKMAYPANIQPRQHPLFIEGQLRLAGFDVHVYENRFIEGGNVVYKTPDQIAALSISSTEHAETTLHGENTVHGSEGYRVIANSTDGVETYSFGGNENLWASFYISGETVSSNASVPQEREKEFRELVLKLKPAHTVAFLFVNFI